MATETLNSYRGNALKAYSNHKCAYCGFGIEAILDVAHLDQNHANTSTDNLALLCPTCHRMHDIGLIPTKIILQMRDQQMNPNWSLLMKDAALKAAAKRKENTAKKKRSMVAQKAVAARKINLAKKQKATEPHD